MSDDVNWPKALMAAFDASDAAQAQSVYDARNAHARLTDALGIAMQGIPAPSPKKRHPEIHAIIGLVSEDPYTLKAEVERIMRDRGIDENEILQFRREMNEAAAPAVVAVVKNWITAS